MSSFFLWVCCFTLLAQGYSKDNIAEEVIVPSVEEFDQKDIGKDLITHSSVYFFENFNDKNTLSQLWVTSKSKKETDDGSPLQYDGDWILDKPLKDSLPNDLGLTFHEKVKHRAISSKLFRDFEFSNRPFVIQYEVLHQDGQECGGAYLKLISKERDVKDLNEFNDKTPYTIMFGPDKCGTTNKLHFIFRHKNPLNGSFEEKHCKQPKTRIDEVFTDAKPHLFKLVLDPDNSYEISLDHKIVHEGSLLEDFDPPVNPPREIDDPNDKIPEDWDDRPKIPDPAAKKPENWDENEPPEIPDINAVKPADWLEDEPIHISDPSAEKPHDWDDDMDGEWEAPLVPNPACEDAPGCGPWSPPLIPNPKYKGKWSPPLIDNPNYSGVWKPRRIPNPGYFEDKFPFKMSTIDAVGFELWTISARIMFDNIIITDDENVADQFASITFDKKIINIEKSADTLFNQFVAFTNRYPWLWAVYVVVLLIPIVLVIVCCCWNNKENEAEKKKNDDLMANNYLADESSVSSSSLGATKVDQSDEDRHSRASSHVSDKAEEGSSVSNENNEEDGEDVAEEAGEAGEEVTEMAVQEERRDSDNEADISETSTEPETILKKRK